MVSRNVFQSNDALIYQNMYFYFHIYVIKGDPEGLQQHDLPPPSSVAERENGRKSILF